MNKLKEIAVNCDVGEGLENEIDLLPYIHSCSIACGGHAGDFNTMRNVARLAKQFKVKVGAHPSYPDKENFGRKSVSLSHDALKASIQEQIQNLKIVLEQEQLMLHHIKAHGALYNDMVTNSKLAVLFLKAIASYKSSVSIYVPYGSVIAKEAAASGFKIVYEAFGDRNYNRDLTLVSRSLSHAMIKKPEEVLEHILRMHGDQKVKTIDGELVHIMANTFCIHGDTATALEILMYLSRQFPKK